MKKLALGLIPLLLLGVATQSCGKKGEKDNGPLTIWVGTECIEFYTQKMNDYKAMYEQGGEKFPAFEVI